MRIRVCVCVCMRMWTRSNIIFYFFIFKFHFPSRFSCSKCFSLSRESGKFNFLLLLLFFLPMQMRKCFSCLQIVSGENKRTRKSRTNDDCGRLNTYWFGLFTKPPSFPFVMTLDIIIATFSHFRLFIYIFEFLWNLSTNIFSCHDVNTECWSHSFIYLCVNK